jgi:hypothetical protein
MIVPGRCADSRLKIEMVDPRKAIASTPFDQYCSAWLRGTQWFKGCVRRCTIESYLPGSRSNPISSPIIDIRVEGIIRSFRSERRIEFPIPPILAVLVSPESLPARTRPILRMIKELDSANATSVI